MTGYDRAHSICNDCHVLVVHSPRYSHWRRSSARVWLRPLLAVDSAKLRNSFAVPPREYSSAPLWVWNDMLTEEQVVGTLRDLAGQKVKQVFVHPRPGLMTPYLSEDWFRLWKVALREAERLDMNMWIYDENSYPSGFAGGFVPEAMPESRGKGLELREQESPIKLDENCVAVFRPVQDGYENVTKQAKAGDNFHKASTSSRPCAGRAPRPGMGASSTSTS